MTNYAIKDWAEDDRPREKLITQGTAALSNAELIAILINNGTKESSAVDVSKKLLLAVDNSLRRLSEMNVQDILQLKIKGIGVAKAVSIAAAMELNNRRNKEEKKIKKLTSSTAVAEYLKAHLQHYQHEVFAIVLLDRSLQVVRFEIISHGGLSATIVDPKIIFKKALACNASSIILAHNHPSGNVSPSQADKNITEKIKQAAQFLDISLIDHVIVSELGFFSFADEGIL